MIVLRRRELAAAALCLLAAGCSSPDPKLYTICAVGGTTQRGAAKTVLVQQVAVACYLDRTHWLRNFRRGCPPPSSSAAAARWS